MQYRYFLFDLDGTLIDSTQLILSSFRHARREHFGDELPEQVYLQSFGKPLRTALRELAGSEQRAAQLFDTYIRHNLEQHDRMVRPFDGIEDTLANLTKRDAQMAVVTGKLHAHAVRGLEVTGLAHFFQVVVGGEDTEHGKPHPDPLLRAMKLLDAEPSNTVMIGDSPHDIDAGRAAHVGTAAVTWGPFPRERLEPHRPDHWVEHPAQFVELMR